MNYKQLPQYERCHIQMGLRNNLSYAQIAQQLKRHPSTIGREVKRNQAQTKYQSHSAQQRAVGRRALSTKRIKLTDQIKVKITCLLKQRLSPEQILGYLHRHQQIKLHHSTLYRWIHQDKRQGGKLYRYLRIVSKTYRKRYGSIWYRGKIKDIRQYYPKGTDFNLLKNHEIEQVMKQLNDRPRKTRCYHSPNELFLGLFNPLLIE